MQLVLYGGIRKDHVCTMYGNQFIACIATVILMTVIRIYIYVHTCNLHAYMQFTCIQIDIYIYIHAIYMHTYAYGNIHEPSHEYYAGCSQCRSGFPTLQNPHRWSTNLGDGSTPANGWQLKFTSWICKFMQIHCDPRNKFNGSCFSLTSDIPSYDTYLH